MTTSVRVAAAAVAGGLVLAACGGGGAGGPSGGGGSGEVSDDKIVLGVITDLSGVYSELAGKNAVEAVQMAIDDFKESRGDDLLTDDITVVSADHQNKPEIANTAARQMYDRQGVDLILDVPTSSAALAIAEVAAQAKKPYINIGAATTALEGESCNKYTFHYAYNTFMLANGTGKALTEQGAKNWYVIYPDYAFGQDMNAKFGEAISGAGGSVVAADPTPFPNDNFSTFLLKAPTLNPKPDVLGVMQAGGDLVNVVKQYNEFGLKDQGVGLAVGLMFDTDIAAIGVESLAGTTYTTPWFWTVDEESRAWADRFKERTGTRPTFDHAANYSAATQYLEAVHRAGSDGGDAVVDELEGYTFDDFFARNATIRAEDHLVTHDAYLAQVKEPGEVKEDLDFTKMISKIDAADAFQQPDAACSMGT